jgi:hypothetical protein
VKSRCGSLLAASDAVVKWSFLICLGRGYRAIFPDPSRAVLDGSLPHLSTLEVGALTALSRYKGRLI